MIIFTSKKLPVIMKKYFLYSVLIVSSLLYISFYFPIENPITHFTAASILLSAIYIVLIILIRSFELKKRTLTILISLGIIFRLLLFPIGPIASDDVYRYLWDGKVQANGINPYTYSPNDKSLEHLHSELLPSKVNFQHLKTIYPPYSQWMFLLAYLIAGETLWGIKLLLLLSEIITIISILLTLRNLGADEKYTLVYALSPLPILQFFVDAHVDGFGITLLAVFFYFLSSGKILYSYFSLGLSIASKLITVMVYPFLLKDNDLKSFISLLIIPIVTVGLMYLPYSMDGFPFESLFIFVQKWYSNGAIFTLFQKILDQNFLSRILSLSLFFISFVWLYFSKKDFNEKVYLIFILFFIFSPVVHPWYITWVTLMTAIHFRWSGVVFSSTISIANIYALNYILMNKWEMSQWLLLLEYLSVIILLIVEEIKNSENRELNRALS
jgi:hypothetical protein